MTDSFNKTPSAETGAFPYKRIELTWPGKYVNSIPRQSEDGQWILIPPDERLVVHGLIDLQPYPLDWAGSPSLTISGDRLDSITTLTRGLAQEIRLIYLDVPRIEVDDKNAAFRGDPTFAYSSWLTVLRAHIIAVSPLLRSDGVIVVHTGDIEEPYARLVLEEFFGRENRIATIVWQRAYGPRNMKGMKEFTATHDCLLVYALNKASLPPVGLRVKPEGFSNQDKDPREDWKAEHKGAHSRREKSDFNTYIPPYRWEIKRGRLPDGIWRLSPLTGIIWGIPKESGSFPLEVEVSDSDGKKVSRKLSLTVTETGDSPTFPEIPWLFEEIKTSGKLRITTEELPEAALGKEFSAIVLASGGVPYRSTPKRPGSGRYWEFADYTLLLAYQ